MNPNTRIALSDALKRGYLVESAGAPARRLSDAWRAHHDREETPDVTVRFRRRYAVVRLDLAPVGGLGLSVATREWVARLADRQHRDETIITSHYVRLVVERDKAHDVALWLLRLAAPSRAA